MISVATTISIISPLLLMVAALTVSTTSGCQQHGTEAKHLTFDTPDAAATALVRSVERHDLDELSQLLGPGSEALLSSGDDAADREEREAFLTKYRVAHRFAAGGPDRLVLQVGDQFYPLPIPLIRSNGQWQFDGAAGLQEIAVRRVGRNELRAIDTMRDYAESQQAPDPGPGHGYRYRMLSPGLLATPTHYGSTGIMTFVVKHGGVVWQRDLGERTAELAAAIQSFNPDGTWTPIAQEQ